MYRVYLCTLFEQVYPWSEVTTLDAATAAEAFSDLVNCTFLDGHQLAAIATHNNGPLAIHRYDMAAGNASYWRGKLHEVPWERGTTFLLNTVRPPAPVELPKQA
jgi:hypothetical protein